MKKQCCGTCKWLLKEQQWNFKDCIWEGNLPDSVADIRNGMSDDEGTNCPCYEERKDE